MIQIDWFEKWSIYSPDNVALKDDATGRSFTYSQCYALINRGASFLRDNFGVRKGDRVAILSMNEVEYILLFFSLQKLGAIMVPLNVRLTPREIAFMLRDAEPRLIIFQQQFEQTIAAIDSSILPKKRIPFDGEGGLVSHLFDPSLPSDHVSVDADFSTPCMILYTSGTTGTPKGALITNGMLFWNSINTTMRLNITQADSALIFAPFFHTGGWNVLTTPFLHRGARLINLRKFDPDRVLHLCDAERVTILFGVPTMMDMMYRSSLFSSVSLKTVRYAIVGGEPMPIHLIRIWQEKGVPIRQGYGLTEFGPNVFSLNEEDALRKIGSIGFPNFYVHAKIVNDAGQELPHNEIGELVLRGPVCTPGYWNNEEATIQSIRDGWFHTGDLVRRDAEGYYYVVGRKKDMYISGAENVYPAEVEQFLQTHPNIREVAVIGVPDEKWGEVGKAFIVLNEGVSMSEEEVIEYCKGNLAKFKIPKYVEFIESLPKSESGKILKRALKERSA